MKFKITLIFICYGILVSCRQGKNGQEIAADLKIIAREVVTIKIPDTFKQFPPFQLSKIVDSVWYVKLEKPVGGRIQDVSKIAVHKDHFYILDTRLKSLLKFSRHGKFEGRIGAMGTKKGAYIHPISFAIDHENEELMVYDENQSKIIYYDLTGRFIREQPMGYRFNEFEKYEDNYIISADRRYNFHRNDIRDYRLFYAGMDWVIQKKASRYNAATQVNLASARRSLTWFKDELVYNPSFSYRIYHLTADQIQEKYVIDPGRWKLPAGFDQHLSVKDFLKTYDTKGSNVMYIGKPVFETDGHLVTTFNFNKQFVFFYYDKLSRRLICSTRFNNDMPQVFDYLSPIETLGDTFIGSVDAYKICTAVNAWKKYGMERKIPKPVLAFANSVKLTDNPVLMFFTLKKF